MFNIMLNIMYQGYTEFSSCGSERDRDGTWSHLVLAPKGTNVVHPLFRDIQKANHFNY